MSRMERKKEEKRKAILDAAEKMISKKGEQSMTMDHVATEADVAKGTLYLYFKNKESLCAAVSTRINKELNQLIKEKMELYKTGSEKALASGTAVIEFSKKNPEKWKIITELYHMKFEDFDDSNVQELMNEINNVVQLLAEAYQQGKNEGTMHKDLDPIATAIYNRMAFSNAFTHTSEQSMLLKMNNINKEHYLSVVWNLINRSTHIKPSIREESDIPLEEQRSSVEIAKEINGMVESLGLTAENALEIKDAWETITEIIIGNFEYDTIEASKEKLVVHVTSCPVSITKDSPASINAIEGCPRYSKILVETLNPKYTARITKKICDGDPYCEIIIELKNE